MLDKNPQPFSSQWHKTVGKRVDEFAGTVSVSSKLIITDNLCSK
jgi:hypothetical protein